MNTDVFMIDGHAFSWRRLCELRRQQLEAIRKAQPQQPALFELREDHRPASERTAAGRYLEPSLLGFIQVKPSDEAGNNELTPIMA